MEGRRIGCAGVIRGGDKNRRTVGEFVKGGGGGGLMDSVKSVNRSGYRQTVTIVRMENVVYFIKETRHKVLHSFVQHQRSPFQKRVNAGGR